MTSKSERIPGLDVVRAIAVLLVVVAHSFSILNPLFTVPVVGRGISFVADHILPVATIGVELFFVLSGFLIGNILIREYLDAERFSFTQVRHFWVRRWFRTLPNYWLILTVNIILYSALSLQPVIPYQFSFYLFVQTLIHPAKIFFFNESWSLCIEEWFYLTLPIVMFIAAAVFRARNKKKFLLRVFVGYLLTFVIIRFINAFDPINGPDQDNGIRKVVLFRLDAVMYGVLFAYFNVFGREVLYRYRKAMLAVSLAGAALVYFLLAKRNLQFTASPDRTIRFFSDAFFYLLQPLVLAFCLPYANSITTIGNKALATGAAFVSRISYSLYLIHYTLIFLPFFYQVNTGGPVTTLLFYLLYWATVIMLSAGIYRYYEQPVMKLRDRIAPKKKEGTP